MLLGKDCGYRLNAHGKVKDKDLSKSQVDAAVRLVDRFGFIAITNKYTESVDLFHRLFGGDVQEFDRKNTRPSNKRVFTSKLLFYR